MLRYLDTNSISSYLVINLMVLSLLAQAIALQLFAIATHDTESV
jgi:hypothetical protein